MKYLIAMIAISAISWRGFWYTPDQQGQRLMDREEFVAAAETFADPMRQGVAWYRAGEFKRAEKAFEGSPLPEAEFNRGNCLIMQGKYAQAIERFDRAIELRPDWPEAKTNRDIAVARAAMTKQQGGDMGDQKLGADKIVYDKNKKPGGEESRLEEESAMSDAAIQAMWLRKVQTQPAEFLKSKFAFQINEEGEDR